MARHVPTPFPQGSIEEIAKIVGDLYSGSELTRILDQIGLPDPLGSARFVSSARSTVSSLDVARRAREGLIPRPPAWTTRRIGG